MMDKIEALWVALGALTFAETLEVAETLRDAWESTAGDDFETASIHEWAILLNTSREIYDQRAEEEVA